MDSATASVLIIGFFCLTGVLNTFIKHRWPQERKLDKKDD